MASQILRHATRPARWMAVLLLFAGWSGCAASHRYSSGSGCTAVSCDTVSGPCPHDCAGLPGVWHAGYHGTTWCPLITECGVNGPTIAEPVQPMGPMPSEEVPLPKPAPVQPPPTGTSTSRLPPPTRDELRVPSAAGNGPVVLPSIRDTCPDPFESDRSADGGRRTMRGLPIARASRTWPLVDKSSATFAPVVNLAWQPPVGVESHPADPFQDQPQSANR